MTKCLVLTLQLSSCHLPHLLVVYSTDKFERLFIAEYQPYLLEL